MNLPNPSEILPGASPQTDLVTVVVIINGSPIPDTMPLKNITVSYCANRVPFARITMLDGDVATQEFQSSDQDLLSPGNDIEIKAGYHGTNNTIFKGIIIRHTVKIPQGGASYIELECKDKAVKLTVGRKNKYFFEQKDSDIIEEICRGKVDAAVDSTQPKHKEMVQYFATDWDFIVTRAEANGLLVLADGDQIAVKKPDFSQSSAFTATYGVDIYEFEAEMDARDQYPTAEATNWDPADQSPRKASPGGGGLGGFSIPGGSALSSVTGGLGINLPGVGPNTDYSRVLDLDNYPLQHPGAFTPEEMQAWASAQMTKSQLAKSRGRVKINGRADAKAGDCMTLDGVGQRHSGKALITSVLHEIGEGSWFTHLQFGLSQKWFAQEFDDVTDVEASSLLPAVHGLQIGVVTQLEDTPSDNEFRIKVRLPLVDTQGQGFWSRLASQDAGNKRGAIWRPEIGDEVIVGFLNDDPRQAIVLGSLYSSKNAAPIAAADANNEKGWVTRSGMRFIFNDEKKSIILETPKGKKITIDEDAGKIQLEDENQNKITMDQDGIVISSGKNLTLKATQDLKLEGLNIEQKAQASFKVESQGQAQLQATADMVVKGTFVRIN